MSKLAEHAASTSKKFIEDGTLAPAVTGTPHAKPLESTSLPSNQPMRLGLGTLDRPIHRYHGGHHSSEPAHHPVGAHFRQNASSSTEQTYRVVTTHVIYHDSGH